MLSFNISFGKWISWLITTDNSSISYIKRKEQKKERFHLRGVIRVTHEDKLYPYYSLNKNGITTRHEITQSLAVLGV